MYSVFIAFRDFFAAAKNISFSAPDLRNGLIVNLFCGAILFFYYRGSLVPFSLVMAGFLR